MDSAKIEKPVPGVILVRYQVPEQLAPEHQANLLDELRRAEVNGPVVIVHVLDPSILAVPPAVPAWWLGVSSEEGVRLAGMAVVSDAMMIKTATRGMAIRSAIHGQPIKLRTFSTEGEAVAWARAILDGTAGAEGETP